MEYYVDPKSKGSDAINKVDFTKNESRVPKRIIIEYQTTGTFKDIRKEEQPKTFENMPS